MTSKRRMGQKKSVLTVYICLGKKARNDNDYVEFKRNSSQFSTVYSTISQDLVYITKKSSKEERVTLLSSSCISQKDVGFYFD